MKIESKIKIKLKLESIAESATKLELKKYSRK